MMKKKKSRPHAEWWGWITGCRKPYWELLEVSQQGPKAQKDLTWEGFEGAQLGSLCGGPQEKALWGGLGWSLCVEAHRKKPCEEGLAGPSVWRPMGKSLVRRAWPVPLCGDPQQRVDWDLACDFVWWITGRACVVRPWLVSLCEASQEKLDRALAYELVWWLTGKVRMSEEYWWLEIPVLWDFHRKNQGWEYQWCDIPFLWGSHRKNLCPIKNEILKKKRSAYEVWAPQRSLRLSLYRGQGWEEKYCEKKSSIKNAKNEPQYTLPPYRSLAGAGTLEFWSLQSISFFLVYLRVCTVFVK